MYCNGKISLEAELIFLNSLNGIVCTNDWWQTSNDFCFEINLKNCNTVKPVYNNHPWDPKIVAVVDRWSLFRGQLCNKSFSRDQKMVVVIDRWSLFVGGRYLRFDCTFKFVSMSVLLYFVTLCKESVQFSNKNNNRRQASWSRTDISNPLKWQWNCVHQRLMANK